MVSVTATVGLTAAFARSSSTVAVDMAGGVDSGDGGALAPTAGNTAANAAPSSAASAGASDTAVPPVEIDIADGTYTGDTFTNRWGPVQVQIVYAAGDITDVVVLRYPDGDRRSVAINQRALPRLESNVIASQSADIARVTGATYTWRSYRLSLQSAIDAAVSASQGGG